MLFINYCFHVVALNEINFLYRAEPNFEDGARYSVKIKVGNDWLERDAPGTFCGGKCIFYVCYLH